MDYDKDGSIKANDFETFVKDDAMALDLIQPSEEHGVIDVKVSFY